MKKAATISTCLLILLSGVVWAQVTTGTISGTVTDETGGVLLASRSPSPTPIRASPASLSPVMKGDTVLPV